MLARPLTGTFAASFAIQGVNVVTGVLLARALGPDGRGAVAAVILWPMLLASIGSLGLSDASTYYAARGAKPSAVFGSAASLWVVQSALLVVVGVVIIPLALHQYSGHVRETGYLFLASIPLYLLTNYSVALLQGLGRFTIFNLLRALVPLTSALGLIALRVAGTLSVRGAALAYLATYFFVSITAAVILGRNGAFPLHPDVGLARRMIRFGLRSHLSFVSTTMNERLDQLMISLFLAPAKLGLYVVAVTLTSLTALVGATAELVALPIVARLEPGHTRREVAVRFIRITILMATAVTIPCILAAPFLVRLFFGPAFSAVTGVCQVLLAGAVLLTVARLIGALLKGLGRPLDAGMADLVGLCVTAVGLAALLPTLGLMGAALASLIAYGASMTWMLRRIAVALDARVWTILWPTTPRLGRVEVLSQDARSVPRSLDP
jgi:O-antigen/teichoic acid export membrane protein